MARRRSSKRRGKRSIALPAWLVIAVALAIFYSIVSPPRRLRHWWGEVQGLARVEGHAAILLDAAREHGLDPNLLAGVMMVESRGHIGAVSSARALGLFQLKLPTAVEQAQLMGLPEPSEQTLLSDAALNARLGARYLAWLFSRFEGDEERALIAYNAGPGRLKRWIEEAGSYAAWRAARDAAGDSQVLAYARDVQHYRQSFADRGVIVPPAAGGLLIPAAAEQPTGAERAAPGSTGAPASNSQR